MKKILFLLLLSFSSNAFAQGKIIIIVNESSSISYLTRTQIQELFFKTVREWQDGSAVRFFDRVDSPERNIFLKYYLRRTQRQVDRYWIAQKLRSGASAPTQLTSDSMTASLVARFPGGIGYVSETFRGAKGVKLIEVGD